MPVTLSHLNEINGNYNAERNGLKWQLKLQTAKVKITLIY
jgi:hypothetical protein